MDREWEYAAAIQYVQHASAISTFVLITNDQ